MEEITYCGTCGAYWNCDCHSNIDMGNIPILQEISKAMDSINLVSLYDTDIFGKTYDYRTGEWIKLGYTN